MYPREAVVAEKYHTITVLALGNSRMKDFYDLWFLAKHFPFKGPVLAQAVRETFDRRRTTIPGAPPPGFTAEFWADGTREAGWDAFLRRTGALGASKLSLETAARLARDLLMPVMEDPVPDRWPPGGPWSAA
jgi:hypothetical protein